VLNLHDLYPATAIELGILTNPLLIGAARALETLTYRCVTQIIVSAPGSRRYLIDDKGYPPSKVQLVFNWLDARSLEKSGDGAVFRRIHRLEDRFLVTYAGIMGYAQDLGPVISCAKRLQDDPRILFLLVGEGVCRSRWESLASGLGNVRFLPNLDREAYFELLRSSDVCLAALSADLRSPAIPGKLQSIMSVGRPVVLLAGAKTDAARTVKQSGGGFDLEPWDEAGLEATLRRLAEDPALVEEKGRNGRRFAETNFNADIAVRKIEQTVARAAR